MTRSIYRSLGGRQHLQDLYLKAMKRLPQQVHAARS